jgi:Mg2+ and Co2+ transporter CorA
MAAIQVITNPTRRDIAQFLRKYPRLDTSIVKKIQENNVRVELKKHEKYVFLIFYIPEYITQNRAIASVELNIFFDRQDNSATIFAFNTNHFFARYKRHIQKIQVTSFSKFIEDILTIILDDEAKIIDHILQDTKEVKEEFYSSNDPVSLIRHLTNNLTNITTLTLVFDNQDRLLDKAEEYIRHYEDSMISYQRNYINEELEFAKDFCSTLMNSINTKYQVRMTDILYVYTRYTFILFLAGAVFQMAFAFHDDPSPIKITFWLACLGTLAGSLIMLKKF